MLILYAPVNMFSVMSRWFPIFLDWTSTKQRINTHYYNSNLIWRTVSRRVDEVIPADHQRREASRVIQWYGLIHETWYCTQDQVTFIIICLLYTFLWHKFWFYRLFWSLVQNIAGMFFITFCHVIFTSYNMTLRPQVSVSGSMLDIYFT